MAIVQIRRGTTAQWAQSTKILRVGELGIDRTLNRLKIGNGTSLWSDLPFIIGDTGADSTVPGPKGDTGDQGPIGPSGADSTVPGPQGPAGLQGPQGPQGLKGDTGLTGSKGDTGLTGAAGSQGIQGLTGPQGLKGDKGDTGAAGAASTVPGPQGLKGDTGDTGPQGPQGLKGDTGDTGAASAATFNGQTDAITAGLTIDKIAYPAITMLDVTNSGASAYLFMNQYGGSNPTIYAISGTTIGFNLNVSGHPFLIRFSGANYDTGLIHVSTTGDISIGTNAQGKTSGTLYWQIPQGISGNYGYLCSFHSSMAGTITIKDIATI
jgi:plastocyanin